MFWLFLLGAVLSVCVMGTVYMTAMVGRFSLIKSISKNSVRILVSLGCIVVSFAALCIILSVVNAIIVFLHVIVFFLIFGGLFRLISKLTGKKFKVNWQGWSALAVTAVYLSVGAYLCFSVKQTNYTLTTQKDINNLRIAVFADSHIGATFDGEGFAEHMETIKKQSPDIVLIPGDYVDDWSNREDMVRACEALGTIEVKYGVWYTYGNHDSGNFNSRDFSADDLETELKKNNVHVLKDERVYIGDLCIVGRLDASMRERREISSLMQGIDTSKYIIVLDHQPGDYDNEAETAADLVVSGHTHGGQLFPVNRAGEWFGLNDRTYGYERRNDTDFIVTSGIADWAMYFKTGTRSEYVMIDVESDR